MRVSLAATGRFHFFDLARQMHRLGALSAFYTGYPRWKVKDEKLPSSLLRHFFLLHSAYMLAERLSAFPRSLKRELDYQDRRAFDQAVSTHIRPCDVYTAISSCGLLSGRTAKGLGAKYVCDRGSAHIKVQDELLKQEHQKWKIPYKAIDRRVVEREIEEYRESDLITVPSNFAKKTFLDQGIEETKITVIPYGVDLSLFHPVSEPSPDQFRVAFVGGVTLRKGIPDLMLAFKALRLPGKVLHLIGQPDTTLIKHLASHSLWPAEAILMGHVPQIELKTHLSRANVLVLPSIEDGFGLVVAQALACGCPVVTTQNTGASELIIDGRNGFVVPPGDPVALRLAIENIAALPRLNSMRHLAVTSVRTPGGWDSYGNRIFAEYHKLLNRSSKVPR